MLHGVEGRCQGRGEVGLVLRVDDKMQVNSTFYARRNVV
jgi:hypothetical protein